MENLNSLPKEIIAILSAVQKKKKKELWVFIFLLTVPCSIGCGKEQSHYVQMKTHLSQASSANPTQWFKQ